MQGKQNRVAFLEGLKELLTKHNAKLTLSISDTIMQTGIAGITFSIGDGIENDIVEVSKDGYKEITPIIVGKVVRKQ